MNTAVAAPPAPVGPSAPAGVDRLRQATALARRSIIATARQPQNVVPSMLFPLVFCALNTAALNKATHLPGFPAVHSYVDFVMASTVTQGILFGASAAGTDMATDIETGFFDRLVASPVSRSSILIGRLAGQAVFGFIQAIWFLSVLNLFGGRVAAGVAGWAVIIVAATLLSAGVGALSVAIAIRTGNAEAVQGFFPLFFAFLFFSSAFFPRNLMKGWFHAVATYNPLSMLIEAMRHLVIHGFDGVQAVQAIAIPAGLFVVANVVAAMALRARVAAR